MSALFPPRPAVAAEDLPRLIDPGIAGSDRRFRRLATSNGVGVLVLTGAIGVLLAISSIPALAHYGIGFFINSGFQPQQDLFGLASAMVGTVVIAAIALVFAFPLSLATALFITEYAPRRLRTTFVTLIDLMAAIPSLIFGAWGVLAFNGQALGFDRWMSQWLGWIPIFHIPGVDPTAEPFLARSYYQSPLIAGMVVALMVVPLTSSVMRNVFSQAPPGEREAALALGSTRWGMIRTVVLPFGRGGVIGGTMLGLGRALGETVAVLLVLQYNTDLRVHVTANGGVTISSLIANNFGEAYGSTRTALLGAGFVLFLMTLAVNTAAARIVNRSRSGAGVDI